MDENGNRKYTEVLVTLAKSRAVIIYCIRNLNRAPEMNKPLVFAELTRVAQLSGDTINEVMSKVLVVLFNVAKQFEEQVEILTSKNKGK